jgi:hypothetical protein
MINTTVVHEKNVCMSFYQGTWPKMTNCGHFDNIYFKMPIGRLVAYVTNISSYSKYYRKLAVVHSEVNANVLNQFIFIVCNFRPASSTVMSVFTHNCMRSYCSIFSYV